jgi:hypothetical protein
VAQAARLANGTGTVAGTTAAADGCPTTGGGNRVRPAIGENFDSLFIVPILPSDQ